MQLHGAGVQPPVNDSKQGNPPSTHNTNTCNLATSHQPGFVHKPVIRSAILFGDMERLPIFEEDDEDEEDAGSTSAAHPLAHTDSDISATGREQQSSSRRLVPADVPPLGASSGRSSRFLRSAPAVSVRDTRPLVSACRRRADAIRPAGSDCSDMSGPRHNCSGRADESRSWLVDADPDDQSSGLLEPPSPTTMGRFSVVNIPAWALFDAPVSPEPSPPGMNTSVPAPPEPSPPTLAQPIPGSENTLGCTLASGVPSINALSLAFSSMSDWRASVVASSPRREHGTLDSSVETPAALPTVTHYTPAFEVLHCPHCPAPSKSKSKQVSESAQAGLSAQNKKLVQQNIELGKASERQLEKTSELELQNRELKAQLASAAKDKRNLQNELSKQARQAAETCERWAREEGVVREELRETRVMLEDRWLEWQQSNAGRAEEIAHDQQYSLLVDQDQEIEQMGVEELCERAAQLQQTLARVLAQLPIAATRQAEEAAARAINLGEGRLCVVCMDRQTTVVVEPCMHVCMCSKCVADNCITNCPICRKKITAIREVYHS